MRIRQGLILWLILALMRPAHAESNGLEEYVTNTQELYHTESESEDHLFSDISTSMLGWGVGLAVVIGVLAAVIPQSRD